MDTYPATYVHRFELNADNSLGRRYGKATPEEAAPFLDPTHANLRTLLNSPKSV